MAAPTRSGSFTEFTPEMMEWFKQFAAANAAGQAPPAQPAGAPTVQTPFFVTLDPGAAPIAPTQAGTPGGAIPIPDAWAQAEALAKPRQGK